MTRIPMNGDARGATFEEYLSSLGASPGEIELGMLQEFPGPYLRIAYERSYQDFERLLGYEDLHPGYFTVLSAIRRNPGINQAAIGRISGRDKSWVTKTLRQLEDSGLIRRVRVENDRRSYGSYMTEQGEGLHDRMEAKAQEHLDNLAKAIGHDGCAQLVALLRQIIVALPAQDRTADS